MRAATRERIALAVAEVNGWDYCLSAHTYLGRRVAGLDDPEITANRNGRSNEPKPDAAVLFATRVLRERGRVTDADVAIVRDAGYSDTGIIEIVQHVALKVWTIFFNNVVQTEIDFPVVEARKAA